MTISTLPPELVAYIASYTNNCTASRIRQACSILYQRITVNDLVKRKIYDLKASSNAISLCARTSWPGLEKIEVDRDGMYNFLRAPQSPHSQSSNYVLRAVQELLKAGFDVNADYGGALRAAASRGDLQVCFLLIASGAGVNLRAPKNLCRNGCIIGEFTALEQAAANGNAGLIPLLLGAGASLHAFHNMALRVACSRGFGAIVDELIAAGASASHGENVPFVESWKMLHRPLQVASSAGHADIVAALIANGAQVNDGDEDERPLQLAAAAGHVDVCRLLLQAGANLAVTRAKQWQNHGDEVGEEMNALSRAIRLGHFGVARTLLDAGADHAAKDEALHVAATHGQIVMVADLLARGCNVTPRARKAQCPLRAGAANGHHKVVALLLEAGANAGKNRNAALCAAVSAGHTSIISILISAGASPSARGSVALLRAVEGRHFQAVRRLIRIGADPGHRSGRILQEAATSGDVRIIVEFLHWAACQSDNLTVLKPLVLGLASIICQKSPDEMELAEWGPANWCTSSSIIT
ncbi:hypothetical protein HDU87_001275 [Geranomyces variabilis]|uniref:Ankyrin repeat protein n=1 Tax=Geranomyces variabilis TaxID=109894 RepID=A0AAD5TCF0_9FUNG|nr:hypothetical protein HDU87_001275 [Geranomyces variabilis]